MTNTSFLSERVPTEAPNIDPVPDGVIRPLWSVMIPLYNSYKFLESTIRSVLMQDPGRDKMEIMVVDDCSTDGDIEGLLKRIADDRVVYYRQPQNVGLLRNFQSCISLSRGHYIHLLHGDDEVMDGFFGEIESLFTEYPFIGAAFTEFVYIDKDGEKLWDNEKVSETKGVLKNWLNTIAENQRLQFCSKVVRRETYEKVGSFYGSLFAQDWILWVKIASQFQVGYSPKVLARYRRIDSITNSSALSMRSGKNFENTLHDLELLSIYIPEEDRQKVMRKAKIKIAENHAFWSHNIYHDYRDSTSALRQVVKSLNLHTNFKVLKYSFLLLIKIIFGYGKIKRALTRNLNN